MVAMVMPDAVSVNAACADGDDEQEANQKDELAHVFVSLLPVSADVNGHAEMTVAMVDVDVTRGLDMPGAVVPVVSAAGAVNVAAGDDPATAVPGVPAVIVMDVAGHDVHAMVAVPRRHVHVVLRMKVPAAAVVVVPAAVVVAVSSDDHPGGAVPDVPAIVVMDVHDRGSGRRLAAALPYDDGPSDAA